MGSSPQSYRDRTSYPRPDYPTPPPSFSTTYPPLSPNAFHHEAPYAFFSSPYVTLIGYQHQQRQQPPTPGAPSPPGIDSQFNAQGLHEVNTATARANHNYNNNNHNANNDSDVVSVSTTFHPGITPTPDTTLSSSDGVLFYVHSPTLLQSSPALFSSYLRRPSSGPAGQIINLDTPAAALNVILHALYGISPEAHRPDVDTLILAVDHMPLYSISPAAFLRPTSPLFNLLLSATPLRPLDIYALSAHHSIHPLAVAASSSLLGHDLSTISDVVAERIGALYLKKLMLLHVGRSDALKECLLRPPHPHAPTKGCSFSDQKGLTRAWALVSAQLVWEAKPDISITAMQNSLQPLTENLKCEQCLKSLQDRIKAVVVHWASVKRTI